MLPSRGLRLVHLHRVPVELVLVVEMVDSLDVVWRLGVGDAGGVDEGGGEVVASEEVGVGENARTPKANMRLAGRSS